MDPLSLSTQSDNFTSFAKYAFVFWENIISYANVKPCFLHLSSLLLSSTGTINIMIYPKKIISLDNKTYGCILQSQKHPPPSLKHS